MVEGQLLAGAADAPVFEVSALEAEAELPEGFQDRLLDRQGVHRKGVEVALVLGAGHPQLGTDSQDDAEWLAVQLRDGGFPRQGDRERHGAALALGEVEAAADVETFEDGRAVILAGVMCGFGIRDEFERDVLDVEVRPATSQVDFAGHASAGPDGRV